MKQNSSAITYLNQVSISADKKQIKSQYKKLSLIYHPDKPTGNDKLFMKLKKAYDALTDETARCKVKFFLTVADFVVARYNWEHYGNPDGPQAMQFGIGLPAWIVEEKNSVFVLGVYALIFMIGLPVAVWYWWSRSSKYSGEQVEIKTDGICNSSNDCLTGAAGHHPVVLLLLPQDPAHDAEESPYGPRCQP